VIWISWRRLDAASAGDAQRENSIPVIKRGLQRNPIPAQKKQPEFYSTSSFKIDVAFGTGNRFPQRKNSSNRTHAWALVCWGNGGGNGHQSGSAVTTSHLFWPNQRRNARSLLPIWLRNFDFAAPERWQGGGGGPPHAVGNMPRSISSHRILWLMAPLPPASCLKKHPAERARIPKNNEPSNRSPHFAAHLSPTSI